MDWSSKYAAEAELSDNGESRGEGSRRKKEESGVREDKEKEEGAWFETSDPMRVWREYQQSDSFDLVPCLPVRTPIGVAKYDVPRKRTREQVFELLQHPLDNMKWSITPPDYFSDLGKDCYQFAYGVNHGCEPKLDRFSFKAGVIMYDNAPVMPQVLPSMDKDVRMEIYKTLSFLASMSTFFLMDQGFAKNLFWVGNAGATDDQDAASLYRNGFVVNSLYLACEIPQIKSVCSLARQITNRWLYEEYLPDILMAIGSTSGVPQSYRCKLYSLGETLKKGDASAITTLSKLRGIRHKPADLPEVPLRLETLVTACCGPEEKTVYGSRLLRIAKYAESVLHAPVFALLSVCSYTYSVEKKGAELINTAEVTVDLHFEPTGCHIGTYKIPITITKLAAQLYFAIIYAAYRYAIVNIPMLNSIGLFRGGVVGKGNVALYRSLCDKYGVRFPWHLCQKPEARKEICGVISDRWNAPCSFGEALCSRVSYTAIVVGKKGIEKITEDWETVWKSIYPGESPRVGKMSFITGNFMVTATEDDSVVVIYPQVPWTSIEDWKKLSRSQSDAWERYNELPSFSTTGKFHIIPDISPNLLKVAAKYEEQQEHKKDATNFKKYDGPADHGKDITFEMRMRSYSNLPFPYHERLEAANYYTMSQIATSRLWTSVEELNSALKPYCRHPELPKWCRTWINNHEKARWHNDTKGEDARREALRKAGINVPDRSKVESWYADSPKKKKPPPGSFKR